MNLIVLMLHNFIMGLRERLNPMPKSPRQINLRLSEKMIKAIDLAIEIGAANNRSDFIRAAIAEKLQDLSVFKTLLKEVKKNNI